MQPFTLAAEDRVLEYNFEFGDGAAVVLGDVISVRTDSGTRVAAWRAPETPDTWRRRLLGSSNAYIPAVDTHKYFCHGFALRTFLPARDAGLNYSVLGDQMIPVLQDEYDPVYRTRQGTAAHVQFMDVLLFWNVHPRDPQQAGSHAGHSAVILTPRVTAQGELDVGTTLLTKNGVLQAPTKATIAQTMQVYPGAPYLQVFRRKTLL